jgi:hypothetical protein
LACAAAAVFVFFGGAVNYVDDDTSELLSFLAVMACMACIGRLWQALEAGIRFSRLLRRPSDPPRSAGLVSGHLVASAGLPVAPVRQGCNIHPRSGRLGSIHLLGMGVAARWFGATPSGDDGAR